MNDGDAPSFNLIDQPWLWVRRLDGTCTELSLVDTFRQAHDLAGLVGEVPTQVFALTRLLLAVLHAATAGPRDLEHWEELWAGDQLASADIERYLRERVDRFDLFHPTTPFLQVAGLHTKSGDMSELTKLIADVPNGEPFFSTRLDLAPRLPFPEAARWLVHCHAFDPSGIKSGADGDRSVKGGKGYPIGTGWSGALGGVLPEGHTLRETLLLNLIPRGYGDLIGKAVTDRPAWDREPVRAAEEVPGGRPPTGPVDLYTWQSRRVRLHPDGQHVVAVLICNGDRSAPQNKHRQEPHTAWRRSAAQEKKHGRALVYMPKEHDPSRAVWRGLQALLPGARTEQSGEAAPTLPPTVLEWISHLGVHVLAGDYPVRVRTVGMAYGPQSSTTTEIIDDAVALQAILLSQDASDLVGVAVSCVAASESAARALGTLAANLAGAAGGEADGPRSRAVELAFAELDPMFRTWLAGLGPDTDPLAVQQDWHQTTHRTISTLGRELLNRAAPAAWSGRTVKNGKGQTRLVTTSHADQWFRNDLRRTLPLAHTNLADPSATTGRTA